MKPIFPWRVSSLVSFTAFSVILGSYSAQANETAAISAASQTQIPSAATWWSPAVDSTKMAAIAPTAPSTEAAPEARASKNSATAASGDSLPQWLAKSDFQPLDPENLTTPISEAQKASLPATEPAESPTVKLLNRPTFSTSATDLTSDLATPPEEVSADSDIAQVRRPIRRSRPGANFIGIGGNIGDNEDLIDLTILSKIRLIDLPFADRPWTLSGRPSIAFSNGIFDLRLPATIEFTQPTLTPTLGAERLTPFAGGGVAISLERDGGDSELDLMLTGGADYLVSADVSLTAMVNFLFLDDIDLEVQFGIGYNF